ncbi:MAG: glycerol kinase, partial [Selenomonadaceae bacterium]|nr:glycerol kinase [Selenomonadaceae bacterium]
YWDSNARGMVTGMSRVTGKNEFVRAALDSIVYQISDIALLMAQESGHALKSLRVDGGPTKNKYLMEFQSNILQLPVEVAAIEEISAAGAAYMAGIAAGLYEPALLQQMHRTTFQPDMAQDLRDELYAGWKAAIHQVQQTR